MATTEHDLESLPPRIARLIEQERGHLLLPTEWAELESRMWGRIGQGVPPPWHGHRLARALLGTKSIGFLLLSTGVVLGVLGGTLMRNRAPRIAAVPSPVASLTPVAPAPTEPPAAPPPAPKAVLQVAPARGNPVPRPMPHRQRLAEAPLQGPSAPVVAGAPAPLAPTPDPKIRYAEEQALLERAREALRDGAPADAFALALEHASRFPDGALSEERELICIRALKALRQRREMVERILDFHRRHPNSLLIPAVDALAPSISGE
jgi:hypothetical protein